MNRNYVIFEPQCIGFVHAKVNAAYILLFSKAFPNEEIVFLGDAAHIDLIREELSVHALDVQYIPIQIPNVEQSYLARFLCEFRNALNVFHIAKRRQSNILLLSITSQTLLAVKLLGLAVRKKIFIVVHGILERIIQPPMGILHRIFWFKYYLTILNMRNLKYIMIGEFIESNALALLPNLKGYTRPLDLPYDFSNPADGELKKSLNIVFASAGVAAIAKGSHRFFELADDIVKKKKISNVEFVYIGQFVDRSMRSLENDSVLLPSRDEPLEQSTYQSYFLKSDFLVFFYPKDSYKLIFSGVFMDAVKFEKPIIAIKNEFFSYYFKKYGTLGWLCEDYQEVRDLVVRLTTSISQSELDAISKNFQKIKSELSIDKQASIFRELLD